jgi:hypothetical protein
VALSLTSSASSSSLLAPLNVATTITIKPRAAWAGTGGGDAT